MNRPFGLRMTRPTALTTPKVRVRSSPNGLPRATANCPGWRSFELPMGSGSGSSSTSTFSTARSVEGSLPTSSAGYISFSPKETAMFSAFFTL